MSHLNKHNLTLRLALKEKDQRLAALEATFDSFNSGELDTGEPDTAEQDKESPSTAQHKGASLPCLRHGKDADLRISAT